ncbi:MAG TPA: YgiT-type zinc finger protein [Blastocatellia bacterium]|nr:YgiT-type zinc finger protein [Blastocatellia bacterium]HMV83703.1 YgiT-type zinc finger protein [Blastocatellia bacterium]HMY70881.1 YgiT-type zinc finger protein [Blastocatellia bacterium]HMZ19026.1 YgiT-type zinc finger protein [Blastocatellia bacterium]HNG29990.1 YgiT-type zinc finger protein [Blastocatellia bacterium]
MKCEMCKAETVIKREQRYHYTECGLDNVYLENIDVRVCEACGEVAPRIPRINDLHATIGQAIALQSQPLSGKEARFLRQHLGLKAKEWAAYLHIDTATLSRWENGGQTIGPQADSLMRLMYFYLLAEKQGRAIPAHVADQLAAIVLQRSDAMALLVNPHKPARYSYRLESELAYA